MDRRSFLLVLFAAGVAAGLIAVGFNADNEASPGLPQSEGASDFVELRYETDGQLASLYRLFPPEPTADAMGAVRSAYRLESSISPTTPPWQVEWIDGNLRYVKSLTPCTWDSKHADECGAAEIYWQSVGRERNDLKSAVASVYSAGIFALQQERLLSMSTYNASIQEVGGRTVLQAETRDGRTTFTYGSSRHWPDVVDFQGDDASQRWVLADQRARELPDLPEVWPKSDLPDVRRDDRRIFPGSDLDLLGSGTSIQEHYEALRANDAAAQVLADGGCVKQVNHYLAGHRDPRPVHGVLTRQITTTQFDVVSSEGQRSAWKVTSTNHSVEGQSDPVVGPDGDRSAVRADTCMQLKHQAWTNVPTLEIHKWVAELGSVPRAHTFVSYHFLDNRGAEEWSERVDFSYIPNQPDGSASISVGRPNSIAFELADGGALLHAYMDKPTHLPFLDGGWVHPTR